MFLWTRGIPVVAKPPGLERALAALDAGHCSLTEAWADAASKTSKVLMTTFANLAKWECGLIKERVQAANCSR